MIREFHLADFFTLANAACGMGAVLFSMFYMGSRSVDHFFAAAALVAAALVFDDLFDVGGGEFLDVHHE